MIVGITGGTGFIGEKLVASHLALGDEVRALSRCLDSAQKTVSGVSIFCGDVTNSPDDLVSFVDGLDILYNCCAEINDRTRMYDVHVNGTRNLCLAAAGRINHWVQLSSVGVYGQQLCGDITEAHPFMPQGVYEETKAAAEGVVVDGAAKGGFSWAVLRPSIVYGPTMTNRSLFQLITIIDRGLFFFIGRQGARANYIHVNNVVDALLFCGRKTAARGRVYNLNDGCSMEEFVATIAVELNKKTPTLRMPAVVAKSIARLGSLWSAFPLTRSRIDALNCRCDYRAGRIREELGYQHSVSMAEGLRQMVVECKRQRIAGQS